MSSPAGFSCCRLLDRGARPRYRRGGWTCCSGFLWAGRCSTGSWRREDLSRLELVVGGRQVAGGSGAKPGCYARVEGTRAGTCPRRSSTMEAWRLRRAASDTNKGDPGPRIASSLVLLRQNSECFRTCPVSKATLRNLTASPNSVGCWTLLVMSDFVRNLTLRYCDPKNKRENRRESSGILVISNRQAFMVRVIYLMRGRTIVVIVVFVVRLIIIVVRMNDAVAWLWVRPKKLIQHSLRILFHELRLFWWCS